MRFNRMSTFPLALAILTLVTASVLAAGPFTIKGILLDAQGQPVPDYPLRITPLLPVGGPDVANLGYKIAGRDEHATYTDERGEFVMTRVMDYPEVAHHSYRIWAGSIVDAKQDLHPYVRVNYKVDLSTLTGSEGYIVVKSEPGSALKLVAKTPDGRPYNGTASVCVAGGIHSFVMTAVFEDGVSFTPALPIGTAKQMGQVVVLRDKTSKETMEKILAKGQTLDSLMNGPLTEGALVNKSAPFLPFQTTVVEVTMPE